MLGNHDGMAVFRRAVPPQWQFIGGAGFAVALVAVLHFVFTAQAAWPLLSLQLLTVVVASACGGLLAGLTATAVVVGYHLELVALPTPNNDFAWPALLTLSTLTIAVVVGLLREDLGRIGTDLDQTRTLLAAANMRLERTKETEAMRAYYDPMTDLPTRRLVIDRFGQVLPQARRSSTFAAMVLLDLTAFKEVNQTFGYDVGNEVLRQVGQRLTMLMRRGDTVGRLEGSKFVILLTGLADRSGVDAATQKLRDGLLEPFMVGNPPREVHVAASLGIAICPDQGEEWDVLYREADEALRVAKGTR
jgi:diguanylate cyclase (GGDEF)-like protein